LYMCVKTHDKRTEMAFVIIIIIVDTTETSFVVIITKKLETTNFMTSDSIFSLNINTVIYIIDSELLYIQFRCTVWIIVMNSFYVTRKPGRPYYGSLCT
jgi:hypothetical protein